MTSSKSSHEWILAPHREDRDRAQDPLEGLIFHVDAHRNHRGPYTGAGALLRSIVPSAVDRAPALVQFHALTLLSISPELERCIRVSPELAKSFTFSREGNSRSWTLRLAHGLTDFLSDYFSRAASYPCSISFENADCSDPTDREFIAVLLRRSNPSDLLLRICTSTDKLDEPLLSALTTYSRVMRPDRSASLHHEAVDKHGLARRYVDSDCASGNPLEAQAYASLNPNERRQLHIDRAAVLAALNEPSLLLGAIPFHCERGSHDAEPAMVATKYCMRMAYYHASLDWAERGRRSTDPQTQGKAYADFTRNILFSLLLLGRFEEVKALCDESRSASSDPALLAHCAYGMAILNARLYEPQKRDYTAAKIWIEQSIGFTEKLPESATTAVNIAFLRNTMALVEMRQGHPAEAIRLLTDALEYLHRKAPEKFELECPIFLHNRARLHVAMAQPENAIADYTELLRYEPGNSEAYFDRGVIHQRFGRHLEALEDYDSAIAWSPPYSVVYFNRGQTLAALGQTDRALADYDHALILTPDSVDTLINRACILYESRSLEAAERDVEHGIAVSPNNARLLCLRGLVRLKQRRLSEAREAFDAALNLDPSLPDIWVNRAALSVAEAQPEAALHDLSHALSLREDPIYLYNRGRVFQSQNRWQEAIADYSRALALNGGNSQRILRQQSICRAAMERS